VLCSFSSVLFGLAMSLTSRMLGFVWEAVCSEADAGWAP